MTLTEPDYFAGSDYGPPPNRLEPQQVTPATVRLVVADLLRAPAPEPEPAPPLIPAPPKCKTCTDSHLSKVCTHNVPRCPVDGWPLVDGWCSGCDAIDWQEGDNALMGPVGSGRYFER